MNGIARLPILFSVVLLSTLFSCEEEPYLNTSKNTYADDMADISYVQGHFYTTNYDLSGHAGSQIDLFRYEQNGDEYFISDHFDLEMNGQGYLAMTNDSESLYLQSRSMGLIVKTSTVGEKVWLRSMEDLDAWLSSGISYDAEKDSVYVLSKMILSPHRYRLQVFDTQFASDPGTVNEVSLDMMSYTGNGVYAMTYHKQHHYLLGVDTTGTDILLILDENLNPSAQETIPDSTVVGLTFVGDDLYLGYRDRRIEKHGTYE